MTKIKFLNVTKTSTPPKSPPKPISPIPSPPSTPTIHLNQSEIGPPLTLSPKILPLPVTSPNVISVVQPVQQIPLNTVRVISPSQISYQDQLEPVEEIDLTNDFESEESDKNLLENGRKFNANWLRKKEVCNLPNGIYLMFTIALSLSIITVATTITSIEIKRKI